MLLNYFFKGGPANASLFFHSFSPLTNFMSPPAAT